jgi:hypothetical protein
MTTAETINVHQKDGTLLQTVTLNNVIRDILPTVTNTCANSSDYF